MGKPDAPVRVHETGNAGHKAPSFSSGTNRPMSQYKQNPRGPVVVSENGAGSPSSNQDYVMALLSSNDFNGYLNSSHDARVGPPPSSSSYIDPFETLLHDQEGLFQELAAPQINSDCIMADFPPGVPSSSVLPVDGNSTSSVILGADYSSSDSFYHSVNLQPESHYAYSFPTLSSNNSPNFLHGSTLSSHPHTAFNVGAPVHERAIASSEGTLRPQILIPSVRSTQGTLVSATSMNSATSSAPSEYYYQSDVGLAVQSFSDDAGGDVVSPNTPVTPASARDHKRDIEKKAREKETEAAEILLVAILDASEQAKYHVEKNILLKFRTKRLWRGTPLEGEDISKRLKDFGRANLMANSGTIIRYYQRRCRELEERNKELTRGNEQPALWLQR